VGKVISAFDYLPQQNILDWKKKGYWADQLLCDLLDAHAQKAPQQIAFVDSRRSITYGQLQTLTHRMALSMLEMGLKRGDVVAIQVPNWIEFPALYVAMVRLGLVASLIPPMCREHEVALMLKLSRARAYICPNNFKGFDYLDLSNALKSRSEFKDLSIIVISSDPTLPSEFEKSLEQVTLNPQNIDSLRLLRPSPDDLTEIVFTSGTTGDPKGVMHTHNTVMAPQIAMARSLKIGVGSVLHMASTLAHQTGFLNGIQLTLQIGATTILQDIWNTSAFFALVDLYNIEVSSGSSTYLLDMVRSADLIQHDLSSLRIFRAGGGPIPIAIVQESEEKIKNLTVLRGWGQTENGVVSLSRLNDPALQRATLDGIVQDGMQLRVIDDEGRVLEPGREGQLQCCGPFMCIGYINDPALLAQSTHDGWFDTGDLATIDAKGYLQITGRLKDVIIRGGEKIPVNYVENILYQDSRILEVALVAQSDERLGERVCAHVLCRPNEHITLDLMCDFLRSKGVTKAYWPEFLEVVEDFPRTSNGKIQKAKLRKSA